MKNKKIERKLLIIFSISRRLFVVFIIIINYLNLSALLMIFYVFTLNASHYCTLSPPSECDINFIKPQQVKQSYDFNTSRSQLEVFAEAVSGNYSHYFPGFLSDVFDANEKVSILLGEYANNILQSNFSFIETSQLEEIVKFLGLSKPNLNNLEKRLKDLITDNFKNKDVEKVIASKATINDKEYLWFCYKYHNLEDLREDFYCDLERFGHGRTRIENLSILLFMGIDDNSYRNKGHMKYIFMIKLAILSQLYRPLMFIVPCYQMMSSWDEFFFYIRKGFLPAEPRIREMVINKFLKSWLANPQYIVQNPDKEFGPLEELSRQSRMLLFVLHDPRSQDAARRMHSLSPVRLRTMAISS